MPSSFLETFGLTALTALSRGLPVIGFAKGGLAPFVAPELDLTLEYGRNDAEKLFHLIKKLQNAPLTKGVAKRGDLYSVQIRKEKFKTLAGPDVKKILLVSDFKNRI